MLIRFIAVREFIEAVRQIGVHEIVPVVKCELIENLKFCFLLLAMQQLVLSNQFNESVKAFMHLEGAKSNAGDR